MSLLPTNVMTYDTTTVDGKIKVGDAVVCLPGFNTDGNRISDKSGGGGYIDGKIIMVGSISTIMYRHGTPAHSIIWPIGGSYGIFHQALRLASQEEINAYQRGVRDSYSISRVIDDYSIF